MSEKQSEDISNFNSADFPSIELVYPLAVAAYETAQKRLDAVEKRLQETIAFTVTITFAVVTIFAGKNYDFGKWQFILAIISFFAGIGLCFYARLSGYIILISPTDLFDKTLGDEPAQFKSEFIYFAGQNADTNGAMIFKKAKFNNLAAFLFLAELTLLAYWAAVPGV